MPTIRRRAVLTAGGVNANLLAGSQFEFLQTDSQVQVYAIQDSTGLAGVGEVEVFFGQEIEFVQDRVNLAALGPVIPNDLIVDDIGADRDRLIVRATETGGALGATVVALVKITPLPAM